MTTILPLLLVLAISPAERFQALVKDYEAHPEAFWGTLKQETAAYAPFVELARAEPGSPVAIDALTWVVTHVRDIAAADPAMELLLRDYGKSERLLPAVRGLDRFIDTTLAMIRLLRALQDNPDRPTRTQARLTLDRSLSKRKKYFEIKHTKLDLTMTADPVLRDRIEKRGGVNWPEEESAAAQVDLGKEAERCFEQVISEFADFSDLVDVARRELFELRHLSLGCQAPEIVGRDVDGKTFKLSDYRGKVVILYFWNQGCGPCLGSFPSFRNYVKQFEGKPFALLGINYGDKVSDLLPVRDRGDITWRFWCDGAGDSGPIAAAWNIWKFPTMYVIDAQGLIRYRDLNSGRNTPTAVDLLLREVEAKPN